MQRKLYQNPIFIGDYDALSLWAAELTAYRLNRAPVGRKIYGSATGSSPEKGYSFLHNIMNTGRFDTHGMKVVQLDNYCLPAFHKKGYDTEILEKVCRPLGLESDSLLVPPSQGSADEIAANCLKFNAWLNANPTWVQWFGIGEDGHLGFNPPRATIPSLGTDRDAQLEAYLQEETQLVDLRIATRGVNARFFDDDINQVPLRAVTRMTKSFLASEFNIVFVNSFKKAMAAYAAIKGPVCMEVPASCLQLHPRTIWVVAKEAAGMFAGWGQRENTFTNFLPGYDVFDSNPEIYFRPALAA